MQVKVSYKSPAKRAKAGDQKHWFRLKKLFNNEINKNIHKLQCLKEQITCSPSKKGFITNIALVDIHLLIEKLINKVHYMQPIKSEELNVNDIVEDLAHQLRDNELDNEERDNLICLTNIKIFVTKIIKL